jgi:hypothetical protein
MMRGVTTVTPLFHASSAEPMDDDMMTAYSSRDERRFGPNSAQ